MNAIYVSHDKITGFPIVEAVDFKIGDTLEEFEQLCNLLECDTVRSVELYIDGHYYECRIDDEGKSKQNYPSFPLYYDGEVVDIIVGNMVILSRDDSGHLAGLPPEFIDKMLEEKYFEKKVYEANKALLNLINKKETGCNDD